MEWSSRIVPNHGVGLAGLSRVAFMALCTQFTGAPTSQHESSRPGQSFDADYTSQQKLT